MERAFTFEGPHELVRALEAMDDPDVQVGRAMTSTSSVDVLDAPIGAEEVKTVLEIVTLFVSTVGGVAALRDQLGTFFRRRDAADPDRPPETSSRRITVRDPATNAVIAVIEDAESANAFIDAVTT